MDEPLRGKMDLGLEIGFSGAAKEFSKSPYVITFESSPEDLDGWTGKGPAPAARPGAKKAPATKKK